MGGRIINTEISDEELIRSSRAGDRSALEALYSRHHDAGLRFARRLMTNKTDAEDVAQDAFLKVTAAMERGNGPKAMFRPYLLRAVRSAAVDRWNAQAKETSTDNTGDIPVEDTSLAAILHRDDPELVMKAFQSLPHRWMTVLWHAEVEREPPRRIAPILGIEPGAVSALLLRARKGLREAYLSAYASAPPRSECEPTFPYLAATVLGTSSARDRRKVKEHTRDCEDCAKALAELTDVGATMRGVLVPLLLIPTGAVVPGGEHLVLPKSSALPYGTGLTAAAITVAVATAAAVGSLALSVSTGAPVAAPPASSVTQAGASQHPGPASGDATTTAQSPPEEPLTVEPSAPADEYPVDPVVPAPVEPGNVPGWVTQVIPRTASAPPENQAPVATSPSSTPTPTRTPVPEPPPTPTDTPTTNPTGTPTPTTVPTPKPTPTEPDCIVFLVVCVSG